MQAKTTGRRRLPGTVADLLSACSQTRVRAARLPWLMVAVALVACGPGVQPAPVPAAPAAVAPAPVVEAAVAPGTASGRVLAYDAQAGAFAPIPNATVALLGSGTAATTDADGRWRLAGLTAGAHRLQVRAAGFTTAETACATSPVAGVEAVNVVLAGGRVGTYGLAQLGGATPIPAPTATTTTRGDTVLNPVFVGVVTDPRGAAIANATVRVTANLQGNATVATASSGPDGVYRVNFPLGAVTYGIEQPTQYAIQAFGTTRGGVPIEKKELVQGLIDAAGASIPDLTNVHLLQLDRFRPPATPSISGPALVAQGGRAFVKAAGVSTSVDEFYLVLVSSEPNAPAVEVAFDVLPTAVTGDIVEFRVPTTLPQRSFSARIVPFGLLAAITPPSALFQYTKADFNADLSAAAGTLTAQGAVGTLNAGKLVVGDSVRYAVVVENASVTTDLPIQLALDVPPGVGVVAGGTQPAGLGTTITTPAVTLLKAANPFTPRKQTIVVDLSTDGLTLAEGTGFNVLQSRVSLLDPPLFLTSGPALPPPLPVADLRPLTLSRPVAREVQLPTAGVANDGIGELSLELAAPAGGALGLLHLVVTTDTSAPSSVAFVRTTGPAVLPLPTGDLVLRIDGLDNLAIALDPTMTLAALAAAIDQRTAIRPSGVTTTPVTHSFVTAGDRLQINRLDTALLPGAAGAPTVSVDLTTSAAVRTALGFTPLTALAIPAISALPNTIVPTAATLTNSVAMGDVTGLALGSAIGLLAGDHLDVALDGTAPVRVALDPTMGLRAVGQAIEQRAGLNPHLTCTTTGGRLGLVRKAGLGFVNPLATAGMQPLRISGSANALSVLGLRDGQLSGFQMPLAGTDVEIVQAQQAGGTRWTPLNVQRIGLASNGAGAERLVQLAFDLLPPAAFSGTDTTTTPIGLVLRIRDLNARQGSRALTLGGGTAPGFQVTGFNLLPGVAATARVRNVGEAPVAVPVSGL